MAPGDNPRHGQKVDLGRNAPVTQEGPGAVPPDSLAAESNNFRKGNQVSANEISSGATEYHNTSASRPHEGSHHSSGGENTGRTGGKAPSYVENQYNRAPGGPHGRNLKEDNSIGTEDKAKNASFTEFGTKDDPARLAEQKFVAQDGIPSGATGGIGRETGIGGENQYDTLNAERPA